MAALPYEAMELERGGQVIASAHAASVLGHPAEGIVWLPNKSFGEKSNAECRRIDSFGLIGCAFGVFDVIEATFRTLGSAASRFV